MNEESLPEPSLKSLEGSMEALDVKLVQNVTLEERTRIEECTRDQSLNEEWYHVQLKRITGSKCGRIASPRKVSRCFDSTTSI